MSVDVRLVQTDSELRQAFALRHRVFIGEGIVGTPSADGLLFDVFDSMPSTRIFVAVEDGEVVGTLRLTLPGEHPSPCDSWFDWRSIASPKLTAAGSMLCTTPAHRNSGVGLELIAVLMAHAVQNGARYGIAAVRPDAAPVIQRMGMEPIAPTFTHPVEQVPVLPMLIDFSANRAWMGSTTQLASAG